MKRVTSPAPIEKRCQLMIVLGVLVMFRTGPAGTMAALPLTTIGPVGLENAQNGAKEAKTAAAISVGRNGATRRRALIVGSSRKIFLLDWGFPCFQVENRRTRKFRNPKS
jgi:hypothetical protein